jgi:metal-responsive CopG/Arc/MetJ family transcriptional regulator
MGSVTIRLDEKLEKLLEQELQLEKKSRSDLVRDALQEYLKRHKRERLIQTMVREMKSLSPEARQEGLDIAEEFLPAENEALELSEGHQFYESSPGEKEDRWWK